MKPLLIKMGKGLLCFFKKNYSNQRDLDIQALDLLDKYLEQLFQRGKDIGKYNKKQAIDQDKNIFRICKEIKNGML